MAEDDDALSTLVVAILFLWDCWMLAGDGATAVFVSHDEWGAVCRLGVLPDELLRGLAALEVLLDKRPRFAP